ncbi:MAG TPA: cytidylate kinase-like family protein [Rectinemataceae bacterium]|nr:cytidylate kinase-like family protein [Rectinemataceae bacterium]
MAIITIVRDLGSLGEEIAQELAKISGYKILDREYIERRLAGYGFKPELQEKLDEKKPGFWASLSEDRADYLHYLKTALYEEAVEGDCIVVGRGGTAAFRSVPSRLAVRVTAPLELRLRRAVDLCMCDEKHARLVVEQSDHDRGGFNKIFFGLDWNDLSTFDLALNTARMDASQAAATIDQLRRHVVDADREAAGRKKLADLVLGQRVATSIVYQSKVRLQSLEAAADGGSVVLYGLANTQHTVERAVAAARAVPGVSEVKSEIQLAQEFSIYP